MKFSNDNIYKKVSFVFLVTAMLLFLVACASSTDDQDNNGNGNGIENGNNNDETDDPTNGDTDYSYVEGASVSEPINGTFVMDLDDGYLYYSTSSSLEVSDFYKQFEQLQLWVSSVEIQYHAYQTKLMIHMMEMPTNSTASDFSERLEAWEDELTLITEAEGYLAAVLIYGLEEPISDAITSSILENLDQIPDEANSLIYFPFAVLDY